MISSEMGETDTNHTERDSPVVTAIATIEKRSQSLRPRLRPRNADESHFTREALAELKRIGGWDKQPFFCHTPKNFIRREPQPDPELVRATFDLRSISGLWRGFKYLFEVSYVNFYVNLSSAISRRLFITHLGKNGLARA